MQKHSQPKVSIIIPVYKVEAYIERCVRSLFSQTLDNLEYIFVDDSSPDKSIDKMLQVLEEYPSRKPQVKIIHHKKNQGVSQSRQDGVDSATGEYIIHCDPDDWVELDMYEHLYNKAKETNADLVLCDYYEETNGNLGKIIIQKPDTLDSQCLVANITGLYSNKLNGCLWNKLIRKELYHSEYFNRNITFQEDDIVLLNILLNPIQIVYLDQPLYHYRIDRAYSLMKNFSSENLTKNLHSLEIVSKLKGKSDSLIYKDSCKAWIGAWIVYRAFPCFDIANSEYTKLFKTYRKYVRYSSEFNTIKKTLVRLSCIMLHKQILKLNNVIHKIKSGRNEI